MYKVYIDLDIHYSVAKIFSDLFEEPTEKSILIDEGYGERFAHAQNQYLDKPIFDEQNRPNYSYYDNVITILSEEEKEMMYPPQEMQKTEIALLKEEVAMLNETIDVILFDVLPDMA